MAVPKGRGKCREVITEAQYSGKEHVDKSEDPDFRVSEAKFQARELRSSFAIVLINLCCFESQTSVGCEPHISRDKSMYSYQRYLPTCLSSGERARQVCGKSGRKIPTTIPTKTVTGRR